MAINPIGVKPKTEETGWDKISKVMGFVNTAVGVGTGIDKLASGKPPAAGLEPSPPIVPDPMDSNPLYRAFKSGRRTA
jgi:hypothetical protein